MPRSLLLAALGLLAPAALAQDGLLTVTVAAPDGAPVPGATVFVGGGLEAPTGPDGRAPFDGVEPGRYPVQVRHGDRPPRLLVASLDGPGPWALEVGDGGLEAGDARDVSGSRFAADGFFDRQAAGLGTILDAGDLDLGGAVHLADLGRGPVPSLRLRDSPYGEVLASRRVWCRKSVFVDGDYSHALTTDIRSVRPEHVVAVEVHERVGELPRRLQGGDYPWAATCGSVLVWTAASLADLS